MKNLKRSALGLSFLIALLCLQGCTSKEDGKKHNDSVRKYSKQCFDGAAQNVATVSGEGMSDLAWQCYKIAEKMADRE